jgi:hypothetical protein
MNFKLRKFEKMDKKYPKILKMIKFRERLGDNW